MLLAKRFFDKLYGSYKKSGRVSFQQLETWIGTERNKGALWNLKDTAHLLFRNDLSQSFFYERLFDWTLGSIFHESMKLKEDIYLLEVYQREGKAFTEQANIPEGVDSRELWEEYEMIITGAKQSADAEMDNMEYLFARGMKQLQKTIVRYKDEGLLIRFLTENESLYEAVYGRGSFEKLCETMYARGLEDAYWYAGKSCREGGWYDEALTLINKALALNPRNEDLRKESEQIRQILDSLT